MTVRVADSDFEEMHREGVTRSPSTPRLRDGTVRCAPIPLSRITRAIAFGQRQMLDCRNWQPRKNLEGRKQRALDHLPSWLPDSISASAAGHFRRWYHGRIHVSVPISPLLLCVSFSR